jgi:hypothetical protein
MAALFSEPRVHVRVDTISRLCGEGPGSVHGEPVSVKLDHLVRIGRAGPGRKKPLLPGSGFHSCHGTFSNQSCPPWSPGWPRTEWLGAKETDAE